MDSPIQIARLPRPKTATKTIAANHARRMRAGTKPTVPPSHFRRGGATVHSRRTRGSRVTRSVQAMTRAVLRFDQALDHLWRALGRYARPVRDGLFIAGLARA